MQTSQRHSTDVSDGESFCWCCVQVWARGFVVVRKRETETKQTQWWAAGVEPERPRHQRVLTPCRTVLSRRVPTPKSRQAYGRKTVHTSCSVLQRCGRLNIPRVRLNRKKVSRKRLLVTSQQLHKCTVSFAISMITLTTSLYLGFQQVSQ